MSHCLFLCPIITHEPLYMIKTVKTTFFEWFYKILSRVDLLVQRKVNCQAKVGSQANVCLFEFAALFQDEHKCLFNSHSFKVSLYIHTCMQAYMNNFLRKYKGLKV